MYLSTIREIIFNKPECLGPYINVLLPLYLAQSKSEQHAIRNIVAESIGKLYINHAQPMEQTVLMALTGNDVLSRITAIKSFKYSAYKNKNPQFFQKVCPILVSLMQDADLEVKQYTLEALSQIVSNKYLYQLLKTNVEEIIGKALAETPIRQDLIEIVDLGPFKHTNDKGAPIRKAAFTLLQAFSQFFQFNQSAVIETAI
jgi:cullin-associated NEDD8-dissociated protein 1